MLSTRNSLLALASFKVLPLVLGIPLGNTFLASSDLLANGRDAQALNAKFATLTAGDSCSDGENACVGTKFAQCTGGTWSVNDCAGGTQCFALPLVNSRGTSVTCDTENDALARIQATGATGG
ncbi:uncharacterized protein FOMMEDRAFT_88318, partial [Fomitiporia mediterranea MF3/22]|uniref:uncharacterized protein n=1 Tax=Fomitiporia mediterranea (strain MF3/22) TaxID=694068 RepID=UPI0004407C85